jgi:hypothetical protein
MAKIKDDMKDKESYHSAQKQYMERNNKDQGRKLGIHGSCL